MPNHLGIILAAATTLISAVPAFAFGSSHSSSSHSSSAAVSRAGTANEIRWGHIGPIVAIDAISIPGTTDKV